MLFSAGSSGSTHVLHSAQTSHTPLYLVRTYFCFLGMKCLFQLFQTQCHLLKPKLMYILRGSVNLYSDPTKGWPHTNCSFPMIQAAPSFNPDSQSCPSRPCFYVNTMPDFPGKFIWMVLYPVSCTLFLAVVCIWRDLTMGYTV